MNFLKNCKPKKCDSIDINWEFCWWVFDKYQTVFFLKKKFKILKTVSDDYCNFFIIDETLHDDSVNDLSKLSEMSFA